VRTPLPFKAKQLIGVSVALIVIVALTTFAQSSAGRRELRRLGIVGQPAAYTELSFNDPLTLPSTLNRTPHAALIPFTITNRSTHVTRYAWKVVLAGIGRVVLHSGATQLGAGQAMMVVAPVEVGCVTRSRVSVILSTGESIGFWAACVGPAPDRSVHHRLESKRGADERARRAHRTLRAP
jgi:hypothetical protein